MSNLRSYLVEMLEQEELRRMEERSLAAAITETRALCHISFDDEEEVVYERTPDFSDDEEVEVSVFEREAASTGKQEADSERMESVERYMRTVFESEDVLGERAQQLGLEGVRPVGQAIGGYMPAIACLGGMMRKKGVRSGVYRKRGGPVVRSVPRAVKLAPDKMVVDLSWREDGRLQGSATVAKRWHTNGAWDVDPVVGGSSINGFTTWSTIYSFNRVLSYQVTMSFSNVEPVPITLDFVHLNSDPGTVGTSYPQWAMSAYGHTHVIGSYAGNSNYVYRAQHSIRQIVGDRMPITSDRYVGSSAANPVDLTFFGVCATDLITSLTNGLNYNLVISLRVEFFDRKNIDDT